MRKREWAIFLIVLIAFSGAFLYIRDKNLFIDEEVYYLQIERFMQGDFRVYDIITSIPGYHFLMAGLGSAFGVSSAGGMRGFNVLIGLTSVFVFFVLVKRIGRIDGFSKGQFGEGSEVINRIVHMQYAFFPILFPFFFLIYTDVLSLLLVLLMFYFVLGRKYIFGGVFGILGFFVRQTNVIWIIFMLVFVYYERKGLKIDFNAMRDVVKDCWVFVLGLIVAGVFFIWNKGFSLGDKGAHEGGIYLGNVFFILFLFFFLFLPLNIANFFKITRFVKKNKWSVLLIIAVFFIYMQFFVVNHPYNFIAPNYFLRNMILSYFDSGLLVKAILFIPIAYSILSLCVVELKRREFYLFYIFSILSLLPMWLIEQRYYLIPLSLFILFKKEERGVVEWWSVVLYFILSAWVFYGIGRNALFL